jgi:hypothetical protein
MKLEGDIESQNSSRPLNAVQVIGRIMYDQISDVKSAFEKIFDYFLTKEHATLLANRNNFEDSYSSLGGKTEDEDKIKDFLPIFATLNDPGQHEVGNVVELNCGHANRPSERESNLFHQHLVEAGLIPGIAEISRQSRSTVSLNSKSSVQALLKQSSQAPVPVQPIAVTIAAQANPH